MEKDILKIKSKIITINKKDKYLYNSTNTLNVKVLNLENTIKGIKDKKIINISASKQEGKELYEFLGGGNQFVFPYSGRIISVSVLCDIKEEKEENPDNFGMFSDVIINNRVTGMASNLILEGIYGIENFEAPHPFAKGDLLSIRKNYNTHQCNSILISFIAELDI